MFKEQEGDAEMAELFAMGLVKEPKDYGTLVLVPCKHKVFCRTHGTFWIRKKFWKFGKAQAEVPKFFGRGVFIFSHRYTALPCDLEMSGWSGKIDLQSKGATKQ